MQIREIVTDAVGQSERRVRHHHVALRGLAQAEQALAQVVACTLAVGLGPQHRSGVRAWRRPVDRKLGEQRRHAALERYRGSIGKFEARRPEQYESYRCVCRRRPLPVRHPSRHR